MKTLKPIILIDDDQEDLELLQLAVKETGYNNAVMCFTDPVKALEHFKSNDIDPLFVLCDLNMPKMTGLQLKKQLTDSNHLKEHTSFYLFSTGNTSRDRAVALGLDLAGYFVKPSSYTEIKDLLKTLIDSETTRQ